MLSLRQLYNEANRLCQTRLNIPPTLQASQLSLHEVKERFQLQQMKDPSLFPEWQGQLPELERWAIHFFGLITNGTDFLFIKVWSQQSTPQYALSEPFSLWRYENDLYKVLGILRRLAGLVTQADVA